eukprot:SAG31_NODE_17_length_35773_cov_25.999271_34_plen_91_part_00
MVFGSAGGGAAGARAMAVVLNLVAALSVQAPAGTTRGQHVCGRLSFKTDDGTSPAVPPGVPPPAPPTTYNYSLPYTIFYNDAGNCKWPTN